MRDYLRIKLWISPLCALLVPSGCHSYSEAGTFDAGTNAPADASADAGASVDGSGSIADGGDAADAPQSVFCDSLVPGPFFCADFDAPSLNDPKVGWDGARAGGNAMTALADARSFSPPRSLYSRSDGATAAALYRQFTFTKRIHIEMKVFFAALPASGQIMPLGLLVAGQQTKDVSLFCGTAGTYFQQGSTTFSPMTSSATGSWRAVLVDVRLPSSITASIDGEPQWTNFTLPQPWTSPMTIQMEVGAQTYMISGSSETWIDDVVVRLDEP